MGSPSAASSLAPSHKLASHCVGAFEPLMPLMGDLLVDDLQYIDDDTFVEELAPSKGYTRLLRLFAGHVKSQIALMSAFPYDRLHNAHDWQTIDFSSEFAPEAIGRSGLGTTRPISTLVTALHQLDEQDLISSGPTCLTLSKSYLGDSDLGHVIDGLNALHKYNKQNPVALIMRLTRLAPDGGSGTIKRLLGVKGLAWLDICQTPLASISSAPAFGALQPCDIERLIFISNMGVKDAALAALFKEDADAKAASEAAHAKYYSITPALPERTALLSNWQGAHARLRDSALQAAARNARRARYHVPTNVRDRVASPHTVTVTEAAWMAVAAGLLGGVLGFVFGLRRPGF